MKFVERTLSTPAENLACDEALLDECEATGQEMLRVWESPVHFVVVGYGNRIETEVDSAC
jgi:lipoate-protein ligase A